MRRGCCAAALALLLCLCGCAPMLERSVSTVQPHASVYRESDESNALRADSYQDLVNALLLLLGDHADSGVVRLYDAEEDRAAQLCADACNEVQQETALGAYLLDYVTYETDSQRAYCELSVTFGYRRTAEQQRAIVNTAGSYSIPALLRKAAGAGEESLCLRISYFTTDRVGVEEMVAAVQSEFDGGDAALPWRVAFYPEGGTPGIVEIRMVYDPDEFPLPDEPDDPVEGDDPDEDGVPGDQTGVESGDETGGEADGGADGTAPERADYPLQAAAQKFSAAG